MATRNSSKRALAAVAVFVCAFGYFSLFRDYGFQIEDEGTLLVQLERVTEGQFPYADFHTGYTPGFFAAGAALLEALHFDVGSLRTAMALLHAAIAAGLYLVAAPLVGGFLALVSPLAYAAWLPIWPGDFVAFNVPYPAWPATAAWVACALAMSAWLRRGGSLLLFVAGAIAGMAFGVKPNAGAFALAASAWIVAVGARESGGLDRAASIAASIAMLFGIWFAFALTVFSIDAAVHLPPCIAVAVISASYGRAALATPRHPRALLALSALAAGFALPTLVWAVPVLGRLGVDGFLRDVLLIGSGAADLYWLPHPSPQLYAAGVTAGIVGVAVAGAAVARGLVAPLVPFALLAGGSIAALVALAVFSLAPEGFRLSVLLQLENAAFWIAPLASLGGVAFFARGLVAGSGSDDSRRRFVALLPLAVAMYLQLYPRADFMHLLMGMPLLFIVALRLLRKVASWWSAGRWGPAFRGRDAVGSYVAFLVCFVLAARFGVNLEPLAQVAARMDKARVGVDTERARLWLEGASADDLEAFGRSAAWLAAHAEPGETVMNFPAVAGVLYFSGTRSPVPHDYWHPGRPSHDDEAAMLKTLRAAPPRFAVTLNSGWYFFAPSPSYFTAMRDFACEGYELAARFGRFDVLRRRDLGDDTPVEVWQPTGSIDAVPDPALGARRQAVRRWLAGLAAEEVASASLPKERTSAILFLRGIRDAGDLRASAWLFAGYRSSDERLRNEAISAMTKVTEAYVAAKNRWACDYEDSALAPYVAGFREDAKALVASGDARVTPFAEILLKVTGS